MNRRICVLALHPGLIGAYGILLAAGLRQRHSGPLKVFANERLQGLPFLEGALRDLDVQWVDTRTRLKGLRANLDVLRRVLGGSFDLVHDTSGSTSATFLPLRSFLCLTSRLVVTEHDPEPHIGEETRAGTLSRNVVRRLATKVHVHGPACSAALERLGVEPSRILVARHGHYGAYNAGRFPAEHRNWSEVLFFGSLRPNKGIEFLPHLAREMARIAPTARLVVAGSMSERAGFARTPWADQLRAVLAELSTMANVLLDNRFIPDEEVERLFRRAGICLIPYRDATQSGVANIALPFGQAVVATRTGDLPDVVQDQVTGRLCDAEASAISNAVLELLLDPVSTRRMGEAGRRFAESQLDWGYIGQQLLDGYPRPRRAIAAA